MTLLQRRLLKLEERVHPTPQMLTIHFTSIGGQDRIIELVLNKPNRRKAFWRDEEGDR